jgi:hypothetical protein
MDPLLFGRGLNTNNFGFKGRGAPFWKYYFILFLNKKTFWQIWAGSNPKTTTLILHLPLTIHDCLFIHFTSCFIFDTIFKWLHCMVKIISWHLLESTIPLGIKMFVLYICCRQFDFVYVSFSFSLTRILSFPISIYIFLSKNMSVSIWIYDSLYCCI